MAERAEHCVPVVTHGTERLIDDDGALIQVLEDERAGAILFVGSTTEPGPREALLASEPDFKTANRSADRWNKMERKDLPPSTAGHRRRTSNSPEWRRLWTG
jgi:hypothetical protein